MAGKEKYARQPERKIFPRPHGQNAGIGRNGNRRLPLLKNPIPRGRTAENGRAATRGMDRKGLKTGGWKNRKGIGYLPQQTQAQRDFPASVWEVVLSGVLNTRHKSPFYSKEDKKEAMVNLEKLGIAHLKKHCYRELSGGQQQRVLLARALCATDSALILDEPVTGLDPAAALEFYDTIKELNKEGVTIVMVTHDIKNALTYATHILHLEQENDFFGTVEEYKKSNVSNMFLGGGENA